MASRAQPSTRNRRVAGALGLGAALGFSAIAAAQPAPPAPPAKAAPGQEAAPRPAPPAPGEEPIYGSEDPGATPRPEPEEVAGPEPPGWERRLDIGADVLWVSRPFTEGAEGQANPVTYRPAVGAGFHLRWDLLEFLRVRAFFEWALHGVTVPHGALATASPASIGKNTPIPEFNANTYAFGAQGDLVWHLSDVARAWVGAGLGWGRFNFPELQLGPAASPFTVHARAFVYWEVPLSLGIAYDLVPGWLSLEYGATAAPVFGESGTALDAFQAIDPKGNIRDLGPLGRIQGSFVQTLGLSLIL
ncbi:MAG: hypothetical protein HY908_34680 [Myxococcales bacterium]|nr:hypothetical protein [Myxococcales bacterium]